MPVWIFFAQGGMETPKRAIIRRADSQETLVALTPGRKVTFTPSPNDPAEFSPVEQMLMKEIARRGLEGTMAWMQSLGKGTRPVAQQALPQVPSSLRRSNAQSFINVKAEATREAAEECGYDEDELWSDYEAFMNGTEACDVKSEVLDEPPAEVRRAMKAERMTARKTLPPKETSQAQEPAEETLHADEQPAEKPDKPKLTIKRCIVPPGHDQVIVQKTVNIFDSSQWKKPVSTEAAVPPQPEPLSDVALDPLHGLSSGCGKKAVKKFLKAAYSMDEWYEYCDERRDGEYELQRDDVQEAARELMVFRAWLGQKKTAHSNAVEASLKEAMKLHRSGEAGRARDEVLKCLQVLGIDGSQLPACEKAVGPAAQTGEPQKDPPAEEPSEAPTQVPSKKQKHNQHGMGADPGEAQPGQAPKKQKTTAASEEKQPAPEPVELLGDATEKEQKTAAAAAAEPLDKQIEKDLEAVVDSAQARAPFWCVWGLV